MSQESDGDNGIVDKLHEAVDGDNEAAQDLIEEADDDSEGDPPADD